MKFLFLLLFSFSSFAGSYYLSDESVDLSKIPLPPVEGSVEDLKDLEEVYLAQVARTESDCKRAAHEAEGFATSFYGPAYGPLTQEEASKLVEFQERLFSEVNYFSRQLKQRYARVRPWNRDARITPCVKLPRSLSYPSGHSAVAYVSSRAFSLLYPERTEAFYTRAEMIASGRIVGGVHHPLDTIAGLALGKEVFEALIKEEAFRKDLEALKE